MNLTKTTADTWPFQDEYSTTTTARPMRKYGFDLSSFSVPLAITALVCMSLCMIVFYTKARRRRLRLLYGQQNNMQSISGGVPMNVNAYRNYGMHLQHNGQDAPSPLSTIDLPPPYEIAIRSPPGVEYSNNSQVYSITGNTPSNVPLPPSYSESLNQTHVSSSSNTAPAIISTPTSTTSHTDTSCRTVNSSRNHLSNTQSQETTHQTSLQKYLSSRNNLNKTNCDKPDDIRQITNSVPKPNTVEEDQGRVEEDNARGREEERGED